MNLATLTTTRKLFKSYDMIWLYNYEEYFVIFAERKTQDKNIYSHIKTTITEKKHISLTKFPIPFSHSLQYSLILLNINNEIMIVQHPKHLPIRDITKTKKCWVIAINNFTIWLTTKKIINIHIKFKEFENIA